MSAPVTVLKIGGSLLRSNAAQELMSALSTMELPGLLIVPGGGAFADAVREEQQRRRLTDAAAHHMALLAMHMTAVCLSDLASGFVPAEHPDDFAAAWRAGFTPVWQPAPMVLAARELPHSWDLTSDSLAAWLAGVLDARRLIVVKSGPLPEHVHEAQTLSEAGIVDPCFPQYVAGQPYRWTVVSGVAGALRALR